MRVSIKSFIAYESVVYHAQNCQAFLVTIKITFPICGHVLYIITTTEVDGVDIAKTSLNDLINSYERGHVFIFFATFVCISCGNLFRYFAALR